MNNPDASFVRMIHALRAGDSLAEQKFWQNYGPVLENVARRHLGGQLQRRFGPDDVAQSACRTFLRRAQLGQFQLPDASALWQLLCAITLSKVREQARYHRRQRRSNDRELSFATADDETPGFDPLDRQPTPEEAAAFADQFHHLMASLDEEERAIVVLKLQDMANPDIAETVGCSQRTVRRIVERLRERFEKALCAPP